MHTHSPASNSVTHPRLLVCLLACALLLGGPGTAMAAEAEMEYYPLKTTASSYQMSSDCPTKKMNLFFTLNYSEQGTLFDTCGIGGAGSGDWSLKHTGDGALAFWIMSPHNRTENSEPNGWCRLASEELLKPGKDYAVLIEVDGEDFVMVVYGDDGEVVLAFADVMPCQLKAKPVYVGDFPGDNSYPKSKGVYRAAIADIHMIYFGPLVSDFESENLKKSWVIKGSGYTGE